jgi:hypothetical protein
MKIGPLLSHLVDLEATYSNALREAAQRDHDEHDVHHQCLTFATAAEKRAARLQPHAERYGRGSGWALIEPTAGSSLLERLRAQYVLAQETAVTWTMALQAAKAARDGELELVATECLSGIDAEAKWFLTRIKTSAPQALVVQ